MEEKTLSIKNVTKKYGDFTALDNFSIELKCGIYGLLGPNGAGKSTLMKCIADTIRPTQGEILFCGNNIYKMDKDFRKKLGYMPQDINFYPFFTGEDTIKYFAGLKDIKADKKFVGKALEEVTLLEAAKRKTGGYSGGMKRRLAIAVTLLNDPDVIIFDEPTAGLDPDERMRFKNLIKKLGKGKIIILATHIISDVEAVSDYSLLIKKGKLIKAIENDVSYEEVPRSPLEKLYAKYFNDETEDV